MIYLPMIPVNTMFLWLLVPPLASWPFIWVNLSLSIGEHLSNTLGRIGLEYTEYVVFSIDRYLYWLCLCRLQRTSPRAWRKHRLWVCGCRSMTKNGTVTFRWVLNEFHVPASMRRMGQSLSKPILCHGLLDATRSALMNKEVFFIGQDGWFF